MHWTTLVLVGQLVSLFAAALCVDSCIQLHPIFEVLHCFPCNVRSSVVLNDV